MVLGSFVHHNSIYVTKMRGKVIQIVAMNYLI